MKSDRVCAQTNYKKPQHIYIYIYIYRGTAPARGGGEGGRGRGEGDFGAPPPTHSPNPLEEAKLHRRTLGLIYEFTQRPHSPTMVSLRGGGQWGGD